MLESVGGRDMSGRKVHDSEDFEVLAGSPNRDLQGYMAYERRTAQFHLHRDRFLRRVFAVRRGV